MKLRTKILIAGAALSVSIAVMAVEVVLFVLFVLFVKWAVAL